MNTNAVRSIDTGVARVDMKFEAVVIPVSDVDRSLAEFWRLGFLILRHTQPFEESETPLFTR
jgi:hypothetical protein